jgi:hypothetical protein
MGRIIAAGGSISVDGTPCDSVAELKALVLAGAGDTGLMNIIAENISGIAGTVKLNEALPPLAKTKGYRPIINIHPGKAIPLI